MESLRVIFLSKTPAANKRPLPKLVEKSILVTSRDSQIGLYGNRIICIRELLCCQSQEVLAAGLSG